MADQSAVRAAAEPVLSSLGLELVDVEVVGSGRARGVVERKDRASGERDEVALGDVVAVVSTR